MSDKWTLPVNPAVYARVLTCTNNSSEYASLICTFIDVWAEDHEIDKVKYAAHIADMIKRKQEQDKEVKK